MNPKHPVGPPMTLGNMRALGVQRLLASCLNDACRHSHTALIDVSKYPADTAFRLYCLSLGVAISVTLVTACTILCLHDILHWPMFH